MSAYSVNNYSAHIQLLKTFKTAEGNINYIDVGEGEPIVLLHGVPNSSWCYRKMINPLVESGYRVVVPDMLGFGQSDKPDDLSLYHTQLHADRLLSLMSELNVKTWTHVCHDAGGVWTWELLLKEPARISRLVVLNTIAFEKGFNPPMNFSHGSIFLSLMTKLYCSSLFGPLIAGGFVKQSTAKAELKKSEINGYLKPLLNKGHNALKYFFGDFKYILKLLPKMHEVLKYWSKPILVVWGEEDKTLDGSEQIPQLVKLCEKTNPEIHLLKNVGHLIMEDQPDYLVELITK